MTDLKLAEMTKNLMKVCKGKIEQMDWLKGLIDHQFKMTFRLSMIQALSFLAFYLFPLIYIIFGSEEDWFFKS